MGNKASSTQTPAYESFEELKKDLDEKGIPNDTSVIVAIDTKGQPADQKHTTKLESVNSIDGALECLGHVLHLGSDLGSDSKSSSANDGNVVFPYFVGSAECNAGGPGGVLPLRPVRGASELLARYHQFIGTQHASQSELSLSGLIKRAIERNDQTRQFHLIVIVIHNDLAITDETKQALKLAARYPLSIVVVYVGGPPSKALVQLTNGKGRFFDNVTLVPFQDVASADAKTRENAMGLACLHKVPSQYATLRKKQGYRPPAEVPVFDDPNWAIEEAYQASLRSEAKLLVLGRNVKTGPVRIGRGAWWDRGSKSLLYADLLGKHVYVYNPETKANTAINVCGEVGMAVPDSEGNLFIATASGVELVEGTNVNAIDTKKDPKDYWIKKHAEIEPQIKSRFITCGTTDCKGRLWLSTAKKENTDSVGGIWCCHGENKVTQPLDSGISHIAGMAFSLDSTRLYAANLHLNSIWAFDHDTKTGVLTNPREIFQPTTQVKGRVSDVAVDSEGKLWVPHYGGGAVVRYDPTDGKAVSILRVPTLLCSSLAFGGEDLDKLYVVCASETVSMKREYYAGSLFVLEDPGARGAVIRPYAHAA